MTVRLDKNDAIKTSSRLLGMLSSSEIRLFELCPPEPADDSDATIRGQTLVTSITTELLYETVSYVWGDKAIQVPIIVDGHEIMITKNLKDALKRIRLAGTSRTLWVDQICISQSDPSEKAIQVPLMGQIFLRATECLCWLGEIRAGISMSDAQAALHILKVHYEHVNGNSAQSTIPHFMKSREAIEGPVRALRSIGKSENAWWRRMWTLQEAILPSQASLLWGPLRISWSIVARGWPRNLSKEFRITFANYSSAYYDLATQVRGIELEKARRSGPLGTAYRFSFRTCAQPHDKVYALIGLFRSGTLKRVEHCDYKLPLAKLYAMFTVDLIQYHKSLLPLAIFNCTRLLRAESTPNLASWALDMAVDGARFPISPPGDSSGPNYARFPLRSYRLYSASGALEIDWKTFCYNSETNELCLSGLFVDEICAAGSPLSPDDGCVWKASDHRIVRCTQEWHHQVKQFHHEKRYVQTSYVPKQGWSWHRAFYLGLIGNAAGVVQEHATPRKADEADVVRVREYVLENKRSSACDEIYATVAHRIMFIAKSGLIGFGPKDLQVGDQVWILRGGNLPMILRRREQDDSMQSRFASIGPAFVSGITYGQLAKDVEKKSTIVTLV